ncbi:MAG: ribosome rescue GTPase HflX [Pseudomonadota bacterium]|nr:ribosome rescue GTPase HflX [Pseudomonadota bacterium]
MFFERPEGGNRAILISQVIDSFDDQPDNEEFELLVDAADFEQLAHIKGHRRSPSPRYFIGDGKLEELKSAIEAFEAGVVIFNHTLSPSQERNLEKALNCFVLDRTGLILDIFSQRAQTYEGRLQVELAQCQHMITRLVRGWTHLERQQGGTGTRGGPGETQLELDKRMLRAHIRQVEKRLAKVRASRAQNRRARQRAEKPVISLVGYTNAGKSSLFNAISGADVLEKNMLFATLDTTLRKVLIDRLGEVLFADTVGFVKQLPHKLVDAFRATLEESIYADLLLHVIDASDPHRDEKMDAVDTVLGDIHADHVPQLRIYNKIDQLEGVEPRLERDDRGQPSAVWMSAKTGAGVELLKLAIFECLQKDTQQTTLVLPPEYAACRSELFSKGCVQSEEISELGEYILAVQVSTPFLNQLKAHYPKIQLVNSSSNACT